MKKVKLHGLVALAVLWAAGAANAQYPADGWFVGHQYTPYVAYDRYLTGAWGWSSLPGNLSQVVYDRGSMVFVKDIMGTVYPLLVDPVTLTQTFVYAYSSSAWAGNGFVARGRIWVLGISGSLAFALIDQTPGPGNSSMVYLGDVRAAVRQVYPQFGYIGAACTNGRELFFGSTIDAAIPFHIFAMDLAAQNPIATIRPIANLASRPGRPVGSLASVGFTMKMGRDGDLMLLDGNLVRVDPRTGAVQTVDSALWWAGHSAPGWRTPNAEFGYNVWENEALALDEDNSGWHIDRVFRYAGGAWSLLPQFSPFDMGYPETTSPVPFLLYGEGCLNSLGKEPRMGWRALPRQGQSFGLTLRDAEPNGLGVFWIGGSDAHWNGLGALPLDASVFGASGCRIFASCDMTYLAITDGSGSASVSIAVPSNPVLNGYEVFAQTISASGVNGAGFVASDAVAIRIR
jgi:hypothetical protein